MNIYLAPASRENLEATIWSSVPFSTISRYCGDDLARHLQLKYKTKNGFKCWAMTESRQQLWESMKPNDLVIFTEKGTGKFNCIADVIHKYSDCPVLGDNLWGVGTGWHYIYFVDNIRPIDIAKPTLLPKLGYVNPKDRLPGIRRVKSESVENILLSYGSIDNFADSLVKGDLRETSITHSISHASDNELGKKSTGKSTPPEWLQKVISRAHRLKGLKEHSERDNEALVERYYRALGYKSYDEIKYRVGYVDIVIASGEQPLVVTEVKKSWSLDKNNSKAVLQAYRYAVQNGARYVVVTNGDYYAIYDRALGLDVTSNFVGEFWLTNLDEHGLELAKYLEKHKLLPKP